MPGLKYKPSYPQELIEFSKENQYFNGTDVDISDLFGVDSKTISNWEKKFPEFASAINTIRRRVITRGENATLKVALGGYTIVEEQITENPDGSRTVKKITKELPPNISALKYLLNNKDPEHWSDKQEVHQTGQTTTTVIVQESDVQVL